MLSALRNGTTLRADGIGRLLVVNERQKEIDLALPMGAL